MGFKAAFKIHAERMISRVTVAQPIVSIRIMRPVNPLSRFTFSYRDFIRQIKINMLLT